MTQRLSAFGILLFILLVGCKERAEVAESIATVGMHGFGIMNAPDQLPLPTNEMLAALGPLNDLDARGLISDPVYVIAGHPHRFLNSPLGQGNRHIVNLMLSQFLQAPLDYDDIERFVQGINTPIMAMIEFQENGVQVPRTVPINRRSTVLTYTDSIKPEEFFKRLLAVSRQFEEIPKRKISDREYFDLTPPNLAIPQKLGVFFVDDKTVVIIEGDEPAIHEVLGDKPPSGAVIERLRRTDIVNSDLVYVASREGVSFGAVQLQGMLQENGLSPSLSHTIALGWRSLTLTVNTQAEADKPMAIAKLDTTTSKVATEIAESILGLIVTGQTMLVSQSETARSSLPIPSDFALSLLSSLKAEAIDSRVETTLMKFDGFDAIAARGISDTQTQIREQQRIQQRTGQLAILTQAFAAYYQKHQRFPTTITDADGTPLLSWRVALLPIIGQEELHQKFKLDEPWDGPTNKPLLESIPPIFSSDVPTLEKTRTVLRFFDSEGTPLADKELKPENLQAPQSTLLFVNVVPEKAVEWTQPDPLEFDVEKIEETVGSVLLGVSFVGQPYAIPIIPLSDPRSVFQRAYLTALVKGQPLPPPQ